MTKTIFNPFTANLDQIDIGDLQSNAGYPGAGDITTNTFSLWWNTATSKLRLYYNHSGTLRYLEFTNPAAGANIYGTMVYGTGTYDV